jgi:mannan endo-1,4-beta-mannosidase
MKRLIVCWITLLTLGVALDDGEDSDSTPKLTDPLATAETKALYRNLYKRAQKGVLFGHEDTLTYGVG